jgi:DNA-binding transcriptional LysR family regulator
MANVDLEELQAFLVVVEAGSFSAAANVKASSRSTLRRRVAALEARTGVPLLLRTRRGIELSAAGRTVASRGRQMLREAVALVDEVRERGEGPAGDVRIVLPVGMPPHVITAWMGALRRRLPLVHLEMRFSEDPVGELTGGGDVALHWGPEPTGSWISHAVFRVPQLLVGAESYLARAGHPRTVGDLAAHPLYCWRGPEGGPAVLHHKNGAALVVDAVATSTDIHLVRQCALAGLGLAYLPDAGVPDLGTSERIVPVLATTVGRARNLVLTMPRALAAVPKVVAVAEHVLGTWQRLPAALIRPIAGRKRERERQ